MSNTHVGVLTVRKVVMFIYIDVVMTDDNNKTTHSHTKQWHFELLAAQGQPDVCHIELKLIHPEMAIHAACSLRNMSVTRAGLLAEKGTYWKGIALDVPDVPTTEAEVLQELHDSKDAGHVGIHNATGL